MYEKEDTTKVSVWARVYAYSRSQTEADLYVSRGCLRLSLYVSARVGQKMDCVYARERVYEKEQSTTVCVWACVYDYSRSQNEGDVYVGRECLWLLVYERACVGQKTD